MRIFEGEPDVLDAGRLEPENARADGVERDLIVAEDHEVHRARNRREHAPFACDDAVDRDELRLDHVL
jgi:hypothetical protein